MASTPHRHRRNQGFLLSLGYWLVFIVASTSTSYAQESDDPILARSFQEVIVLDGQLSERSWSEASPISFSDQDERSDNEITVRALWHSNAIYLGVEVRDAHLETTGADIWRDDCIELFFDPQLDGGRFMRSNDVQIVINVIGRAAFLRGSGTWVTETLDLPESLTYGVWITAVGYSEEIRITWDELGIAPETGLVMGVEIANRDFDSVDEQTSFNRSNCSNLEADSWGHLELEGEPLPAVDPDPDAGPDADDEGDAQLPPNTYRSVDLGCSFSPTRSSSRPLALLVFLGILLSSRINRGS